MAVRPTDRARASRAVREALYSMGIPLICFGSSCPSLQGFSAAPQGKNVPFARPHTLCPAARCRSFLAVPPDRRRSRPGLQQGGIRLRTRSSRHAGHRGRNGPGHRTPPVPVRDGRRHAPHSQLVLLIVHSIAVLPDLAGSPAERRPPGDGVGVQGTRSLSSQHRSTSSSPGGQGWPCPLRCSTEGGASRCGTPYGWPPGCSPPCRRRRSPPPRGLPGGTASPVVRLRRSMGLPGPGATHPDFSLDITPAQLHSRIPAR